MFRLLSYEFRKHGNRSFILVVAAMLLLSLTVTVIGNPDVFTKDGAAAQQVRTDMMALYCDDPAEYERLYEEYKTADDAYEKSLMQNMLDENIPIAYYADQYTAHINGYSDGRLFRDTEYMIHKNEEFHGAVGPLLYDSYSQLAGTEQGTYLYSYYINLILNYEPLYETELPAVQVEGWNEYFADTTPVLFLLIVIVFRTCGVFPLEGHVGFAPILNIAKNKQKLIGTKLLVTLIESGILTLLFTLSPLLLYAPSLKGGNAPVQCLDSFLYAHLSVSIVEFLLLLTLVRVAFFGILGVTLASLGWLTGTEAVPAVFAIGMALFPPVTISGNTFDFLTILQGTFFFTQYRAIKVFHWCVYFLIFLLIAFTLFFTAVVLFTASVRKNSCLTRFAFSGRRREAGKFRKSAGRMYGLMRNEGRKSVASAPCFFLLIVFLAAKVIFSMVYYNSDMDSAEWVYRTYAEKFAGELSAAAEEAISEERDYLRAAGAEYEPAKERYKKGEITRDTFQTYQNRYYYAQSNNTGFQRFQEKYSYLQAQSQNHDNIRIFYDTGIRKFLFNTPDILLILCVTLFVQRICTVENDKFIVILRTSKYGRKPTWRKKYGLALVTTAVLYLAFTAVDFIVLLLDFGFSDWSAGMAVFSEFQYLSSDLTIRQYVMIKAAAGMAGYLLYAGVVFSLALYFRNMFLCAALSVIYYIPMMLAGVGVPYMEKINVCITLAPIHIAETIPYYGACLVISGALLVVSAKKWTYGYLINSDVAAKKKKTEKR